MSEDEKLDICASCPDTLHGKKKEVCGFLYACRLNGERLLPHGAESHTQPNIKQPSSVWAEEHVKVPSVECPCLNPACSLDASIPSGSLAEGKVTIQGGFSLFEGDTMMSVYVMN